MGKKKEEFFTGDWLVYKLKDEKRSQKGRIYSFNVDKNEIVIDRIPINLKSISILYSQKEYRNEYSHNLIAAGFLFPIIDQFNNIVKYDSGLEWHSGVSYTSAGLLATGIAIKLLRRKKYRLKNRFRLAFTY